MPRYTDPSTGKSFSSDEPLTDSELEEAFGGGESPLSKAGAYLLKRGKGFLGALDRLTGLPGQPSPTVGGVASDVAEVGGPLLAGPAAATIGLAAGAGAAAAGATHPEYAEAAGNLATGLGKGVYSALKGGGKATVDVIEEGQKLRAAVPKVRQTISGATAAKFDPIVSYLEKSGRTIRAGTPEADDLLQGLDDALEFAKGPEKRIIDGLKSTIEKYGELTPAQMDEGMKALSQTGKGWSAKSALNKGMSVLGQGTPAEGKLAAAQKEYYRTIIPAKQMAKAMDAKTPGAAATAAVRVWNNITPESRALLDPAGEVGPIVETLARNAPLMGQGGFAAAQAMHRAGIHFLHGNVLQGMLTLAGGVVGGTARAAGRFGAEAGRGAAGAAGALAPTLRENAPQTSPEPLGARDGRQEANGFNPQFGSGLHAMLADARRQGHQIGIASGVRSTARQAELYANAVRKYGANARHWVAPPGKSAHNLGIGADLSFGSPEARAWAHANADKYGVQFRLGNEPWHAEIAGYDPTGQRKQAAPARGGAWDRELAAAAQVVGIPHQLLRIGMRQESSGRPGVTSEAGAHGLMQLMPATFEGLRAQVERINGREPGTASIRDPLDNIVAGALYWREALDKNDGDVQAASQYYFGGPTLRGPKSAAYAEDITNAWGG